MEGSVAGCMDAVEGGLQRRATKITQLRELAHGKWNDSSQS